MTEEKMCRIREICDEGDRTRLVGRYEAVGIAEERIDKGYSVAVRVGGGTACLVQPEMLEKEILTPEVDVEVLIIPPIVGG